MSTLSRRHFLQQASLAAAAGWLPRQSLPSLAQPGQPAATHIYPNRAPLAAGAFYPLPLGSIRPAGWLQRQLQIQADGLSGHLDEIWPDVGSNSGWLGGTGESWERGPYFIDGLVPLAWQLDEPRLKAKARKFIDWTLTHPQPGGMFGPVSNNDWWPRMVMLKALTQYQEATGDPRVIPLLSRYFDYQLANLPARPLRDWGKFRWQDNALSVVWLYNRNGDARLIDLVRLLHQQGFDWEANFRDFKYKERITPEFIKLRENNGLNDVSLATHGVNNGQALKAAPVWYLVTGSATERDGLQQMLTALDTYHGLPNGMFSCDEHLAGRNPSQGSELCTVVETMFSLEQSLAILGDPGIGDRLEEIAFNALPGAFTDDMWAHQYNQESNQVEVSLHRNPWTTDGPESNIYGLEPNFGCCTANFHQGWPKFTASLWMASHEGGLAATAYSPCSVYTTVNGVPVTLFEETDYPFRDHLRISLDPSTPVSFPLQLRIPSWAKDATIRVNKQLVSQPQPGTFAKINRTWQAGDTVELRLPFAPEANRGFNNSVAIRRGPLVFSYPIAGDWLKLRDRGAASDWQVFPSSEWSYALGEDVQNVSAIRVNESAIPSTPFGLRDTAVTLSLPAYPLPSWRSEDGAADPVPVSPAAVMTPVQTVTLVPYAAAKLRITAFPTTGSTQEKTSS